MLCPGAHGVVISPDSKTAYVTCVSDEMAIVDLDTEAHTVRRVPVIADAGTAAAPKCYPYAATISPSGDAVWVSCFQSGEVHRYDVTTGAMDVTHAITLNGPAGFGAFTRDGATLLIPSQGTDAIAFIDAASGTLTSSKLVFGDQCQNIHAVRFTDDETKIMAICEGNHKDPGSLLVLDAVTHDVEQVVTLGIYPDDLAVVRSAPETERSAP